MTGASANNKNWRTEKDALGEVPVPAEHLWGAQTERSRLNFVIGVERHRWGRPVIRAFGLLKKCAALANLELKHLPKDVLQDAAVLVVGDFFRRVHADKRGDCFHAAVRSFGFHGDLFPRRQ